MAVSKLPAMAGPDTHRLKGGRVSYLFEPGHIIWTLNIDGMASGRSSDIR